MNTINPEEVIAKSKFNKFHLAIFLWCFFAISSDGFDIALYGIALPEMLVEYNITPAEAGAIGSYTMIGMMVGTFLLGSLGDVLGKKKVLTICLIVIGVFNFLAGFAPNETMFIVFRFIAAICMGGLMPAVISLMAEYSPLKNRAMIVALMYTGYSIGTIGASLFGIFALEYLNWRFLFWISIVTLVVVPFLLKQFPESTTYHIRKGNHKEIANILNKITNSKTYSKNDIFHLNDVSHETKGVPISKLFNNNRALSTVMFWIAVIGTLMMIAGLANWLPNIMQESGFGVSSSLVFTMILAAGQIAGTIIGGALVDRIGHRNVLLTLLFSGTICFFALSFTDSTALLFILIAIAGACTAGTQNLINPYITMFYPTDVRGTGLSIAVGVGRIGSVTGPLLIGMIFMTSLSPQMSFLGFAIPCLLSAVALLFVQEKNGTLVQKGRRKRKFREAMPAEERV